MRNPISSTTAQMAACFSLENESIDFEKVGDEILDVQHIGTEQNLETYWRIERFKRINAADKWPIQISAILDDGGQHWKGLSRVLTHRHDC
ncbi:hypothetical protein OAH36_00810 [Verrucomicrobia bacterium]|jgi:hypothetical protein|nr:hypothetical protein [Verrucomicrobiota bacterium]MDB4798117.1 hypothetical protein [Verrucomicrobiota bacterium]